MLLQLLITHRGIYIHLKLYSGHKKSKNVDLFSEGLPVTVKGSGVGFKVIFLLQTHEEDGHFLLLFVLTDVILLLQKRPPWKFHFSTVYTFI